MYSKISTVKHYRHVENSKQVQRRISDVLQQTDSLQRRAHYSNYRFDDADRSAREALQSIKKSQRVIGAYDDVLLDDEDIEKIHEDIQRKKYEKIAKQEKYNENRYTFQLGDNEERMLHDSLFL